MDTKKISVLALILSIAAIVLSVYSFTGSALQTGGITEEEFDKLAATYQERQQEKAKEDAANLAKKVKPISEEDHVRGDRNAEITIYEYSDFECPFCKRFSKIPETIVKKYEGKVNTVYRHFDGLHAPLSTKEANATECAAEQGGNNIFFKYHDELYKRTASNGRSLEIKGKTDRGLDLAELPKIAQKLGLNVAEFNKCVDEDRYLGKIKSDTESGLIAGIQGTPGVIIMNNKTGEVITGRGAEPIEAIEAYVEELLNK